MDGHPGGLVQAAVHRGEVTPEERLVSYLQQQFHEQVLEPVSGFVDPRDVMEDATAAYLRELKDRLEPLPFEYRIPLAALNEHLESIPAIVVLAVPLQDASLYEVLQAADLSALPAYETLLRQIAPSTAASVRQRQRTVSTGWPGGQWPNW